MGHREHGVHPTAPPRRCGGNIDCTELVAGTLDLAISVDGALLSAGDGHDALALSSVVVDLRVTELVNGVHAVLAHDAFRSTTIPA